jgi:hypothetical protein
MGELVGPAIIRVPPALRPEVRGETFTETACPVRARLGKPEFPFGKGNQPCRQIGKKFASVWMNATA